VIGLDNTEKTAKFLVEAVIPSATLQFREDQSASVADFKLHYANGDCALLEATTSVDRQAIEAIAAIQDSRKNGSFISRKACQYDWIVHPARNAKINKIRANIDKHLERIEASGLKEFSVFMDAASFPVVKRIWLDLKIEAGRVIKWKSPAIRITLPDSGGKIELKHLIDAVEKEANKADNRKKLKSTDGAESHLFVLIDIRNYMPWVAINDLEPPAEVPALPKEISHIWVAAQTRSNCVYTIWRASKTEAWTRIGPIALPKETA